MASAVQRPIISLTRENCAQIFFIYPGRANRVVNFLELIHKTGLGNRNLALIRDPYHENYERGVSPEVPDLLSLLDWHEKHVEGQPHITERYHLGSSSGGYGALLFGHLLSARKVWAFGPRTARLSTAEPAKAMLKELLAGGTGATEYFIYFAPSNRRDRAFAEYFADCPGIVLCPFEGPDRGWDHMVMQTLMESGTLRQLMPPFVPAARDRRYA